VRYSAVGLAARYGAVGLHALFKLNRRLARGDVRVEETAAEIGFVDAYENGVNQR